jgi:hypothetical protein
MKVLYDEYEEEFTRTAGVQVRVFLSSVDDLWGLLGTPDEGMKEEGGKVESWSGSLCCGVWYGGSVRVVRSYAVASASASLLGDSCDCCFGEVKLWWLGACRGNLFCSIFTTKTFYQCHRVEYSESWRALLLGTCCQQCTVREPPGSFPWLCLFVIRWH